MRIRSLIFGLTLAGLLLACKSASPPAEHVNSPATTRSFGALAWEESATPVRPGVPGKVPFWNVRAKRFIYAPAFDFKTIPNCSRYRYEILSHANQKRYRFEAAQPYEPLSAIWASVPVGDFDITVVGLSASGDSVGLSGKGQYYRAAPFNGVYHEPVMAYDKSALQALENLMNEDYVQYWFAHNKPDPDYLNYRYPAKIYSALVIGAITYARLKPGTPEAEKAVKLATIVADFMLDIRFGEGTAWEHFVPTYYGNTFNEKKPHMNPVNNFTIMGVDAGHAFLDMYDLKGDKKYLEAAKLISRTYLKNQMENGSWYLFVHHATNAPVARNIAIPTAVINYFDRLKGNYGVDGLEAGSQRALSYIMDNPVRTYDWQGQFEDVKARPPYENLSREQACELAMYLLRNRSADTNYVGMAESLIRFSEDQFVIWEKPRPKASKKKSPGWDPANWITPSVQEQYVFWNPVGRAAGIMVETYWQAYRVTGKALYLAKAKSLANSFTLVQQEHGGDYPTFFTKYQMPLWLNSAVYPAKVLMDLERNLRDH